ncbi:MAG: adenylyltransferase/cytidyltransferase family protein, partial [bacterium]
MEVINGLESFPRQRVPVVVALGTFDGVHIGHQALIRRALDRARVIGGRGVVLTFDPHPLQVIAPPAEPFLLTTL